MPVHDWTRVSAGTFHGFHLAWIAEIRKTLNDGLLPPGYYADAEQHLGSDNADLLTLREPADLFDPTGGGEQAATATLARPSHHFVAAFAPFPKPKHIAVRHSSNDAVVAIAEIVSRDNKDRPDTVERFAHKVTGAVRDGVHVLVIDILPPGRHDPRGMHDVIRSAFASEPYALPADEPLTLASYRSDRPDCSADVEPLAVGAAIPLMPLYLTPDFAVDVPLQATYDEAWRGTPRRWREVLGDSL